MPFVMGVDAGATKTQAVVADLQGKVLADVTGGPGNFQDIGVEQARRNVAEVFKKTLKKSGLKASQLSGLCFGMAGADRPVEDAKIIRGFLDRIAASNSYLMVVDVRLMLRLGTDKGVGVAVIAGTGCNSIGVNRAGEEWAVGGWLTQNAGGGHLGQGAVDAAIHGLDGRGPKTLLAPMICREYGLKKLEDVLELSYFDRRHEKKRVIHYPELAPLVFKAAEKKDKAALALLKFEGYELARMVDAVVRKIFRSTSRLNIVMGGSLLQKAKPPLIQKALKQELARMHPKIDFSYTLPTQAPVYGALAYAMDQAAQLRGMP